MIIVIDGPAGTGKSSVARRVAQSWQFSYIDTGAMYRMVTLCCLQKEIELDNRAALQELLDHFDFQVLFKNGQQCYILEGHDVTEEIRSPKVNELVSHLAALPQVRKKLVCFQRKAAQKGPVVFEGRDMGTVVFPNADLKLFLIASSEVRAQRRFREFQEKGKKEVLYEDVLQNIVERDRIDSSRKVSPLVQAVDAVLIDTTHLSIEKVVEMINGLVRDKL